MMDIKLHDESEDTSWAFYTYPIDAPAAAFKGFDSIIELWCRKCPEKSKLPAWRDFDLLDFEGRWGKLALGEIDQENGSVIFALWGTQLTKWWGLDLTHKNIVLESSLGSPAYDEQIDYYRAIFSGHRIGFNFGTMESMERPFVQVKLLELPLSANGDTPTHIFSVAEIIEPGEEPLPLLATLPIDRTTA